MASDREDRPLLTPLAFAIAVAVPLHAAALAVATAVIPPNPVVPVWFVFLPSVTALGVLFFARNSSILRVLALVIPIEACCALMGYYTVGEISGGLLALLVFANVFPLVLALVGKRKTAWLLAGLIALLVIPWPLKYAGHFFRARNEARAISAFAFKQREGTQFPQTLLGYETQDATIHKLLGYQRSEDGEHFTISWSFDPGNLDYWYTSEGEWGYHGD